MSTCVIGVARGPPPACRVSHATHCHLCQAICQWDSLPRRLCHARCQEEDGEVCDWSFARPSASLSSISCDASASALITSARSFLTSTFAEKTWSLLALVSGKRAYVPKSLSAHSPMASSLSALVCQPGVVRARCCLRRYSIACDTVYQTRREVSKGVSPKLFKR